MGGAEDLTHRDEPERASGMRGADDAPSTAPRTRGEIVHNEELQAPQGPVHRGSVRLDNLAESVERTASAWLPSQEEQPAIDMEDAAERAQPAGNGYPYNAPIQDAINQYLDYLAGSAMLPPVIPSQDTNTPIDLPQGADMPPEELPSFIRSKNQALTHLFHSSGVARERRDVFTRSYMAWYTIPRCALVPTGALVAAEGTVVADSTVAGLGLARVQGEDPLSSLLDDFVGAEPVGEQGVRAGVRAATGGAAGAARGRANGRELGEALGEAGIPEEVPDLTSVRIGPWEKVAMATAARSMAGGIGTSVLQTPVAQQPGLAQEVDLEDMDRQVLGAGDELVAGEFVAHFDRRAFADKYPRWVVHDMASEVPLLVRGGGVDFDSACTSDLFEVFGEVRGCVSVFFVEVGAAEEWDKEDEGVWVLGDEVDNAGVDVRHGSVV
ncbi:hypothetical protein B0H14DRAFT_2585110 [Mycena olivaceomarginata]|nr:hypothetical protein B0H14DRAFT_2585110 [Mycena olivaceomarginata]